MNFQTAAIVGVYTCVFSFLAGLIGGVPLGDVVLRALFWGGVGFGGSLGVETVLRSFVPDLFLSSEAGSTPEENPQPRVDITLEEEPLPRGGFVEEVGDEESEAPEPPEPATAAAAEPVESVPSAAPPGGDEEEMPEIGAFLDAFKPGSVEDESAEASNPEYGDYAPVEQGGSSQEVTFDGEAQDPVVLAKAVQTIMKRDA